jgi:hypothetical protein
MNNRDLWRRIPALDGGKFNPAALISVVNDLYAQGEMQGTAVVRGWARGADQGTDSEQDGTVAIGRLHLIIRLLWSPAPPHHSWPMLQMGRPDVDLPPPDTNWPLSPLVVSDDWPFLLVGGYRVGGALAAATPTTERLLEMARWRDSPLNPKSEPLAAADVLIHSVPWQTHISTPQREQVERMVRDQAERAMAGTTVG